MSADILQMSARNDTTTVDYSYTGDLFRARSAISADHGERSTDGMVLVTLSTQDGQSDEVLLDPARGNDFLGTLDRAIAALTLTRDELAARR